MRVELPVRVEVDAPADVVWVLDLPGGPLGRVAWRLGSPVARAGYVASLRPMAARCPREYAG